MARSPLGLLIACGTVKEFTPPQQGDGQEDDDDDEEDDNAGPPTMELDARAATRMIGAALGLGPLDPSRKGAAAAAPAKVAGAIPTASSPSSSSSSGLTAGQTDIAEAGAGVKPSGGSGVPPAQSSEDKLVVVVDGWLRIRLPRAVYALVQVGKQRGRE